MTEQIEGQMNIFQIYGQDIWSGRTCQEHSVPTKVKTSKQSSRKSQGSSAKIVPMFLYLKKASGQSQDALWVTEMTDSPFPSLTDYTMHSFGESPSAERESRLSQILEEHPHQKYCLSERACQGILNRAERRGKELPTVLREALIRQATPLKSGGGVDVDSHGKKAGKGPLVQTELSGTLGVSQDQTLITGVDSYNHTVTGEVAPTLNAASGSSPTHSGPSVITHEKQIEEWVDAGGGQRVPDKDNFNAVVQSMEVFHCRSEEDKAQTLKARDYKDPQIVAYGVDCYNQTQTEEVSKALNSAASDNDHVPCVYGLDRASFNQGKNALYDFSVEEEKAQTLVSRGPGGGTNETVGALCARDYKGVGNQYVSEGKCIVQNYIKPSQ